MAFGPVDQDWLRMWTAVQAHRPARLASESRIAPAAEPGTPLVVHGQVIDPDGMTPAAGVVVFAYQTDRRGYYFTQARPGSSWRLRGWVRTDSGGRFVFRTIRPGPYPGRSQPAHIHFTLESPAYGRQWTPSLNFADDPLVSGEEKEKSDAAGRFGPVRPVHVVDGIAQVSFFVKLKPRPDF